MSKERNILLLVKFSRLWRTAKRLSTKKKYDTLFWIYHERIITDFEEVKND